MSLISHLPLPSMPFQTHVNIVFENGVGEKRLMLKRRLKVVFLSHLQLLRV